MFPSEIVCESEFLSNLKKQKTAKSYSEIGDIPTELHDHDYEFIDPQKDIMLSVLAEVNPNATPP